MKTLKDIKIIGENFLTKNDKICILNFINTNSNLFEKNFSETLKFNLTHRNTFLTIFIKDKNTISIEKSVNNENNYLYKSFITIK